MISVIIPLFNKCAYVDKTIGSVLEQTYTNFELLVVNDGSTDGSLEVVRKYKDPRIRIISTENNGVSAARNLGVKNASFDFVAFLDADDWWAPTFLEEIIGAMQTFPGHKLFATSRTHIFKDKEIEYTHKLLPHRNGIGLIHHIPIIATQLPALHSSTSAFKKKYLLEMGGFNETMTHFEDHECWLRLAQRDPIVFINKPLSFYNKLSGDSLSKQAVHYKDLELYLETILSIKKQQCGRNIALFRKYYRRFVIWSYLKFVPSFMLKERKAIQSLMSCLISKQEMIALGVLSNIGITRLYQKIKRYHGIL